MKRSQPLKRTGIKSKGAKPPCSVDECEYGSHARGLCGTHYQRWRKTGHPLGVGVSGVKAQDVVSSRRVGADLVGFAEDGRAFVMRPIVVRGEPTTRRVYGLVDNCEKCSREFFKKKESTRFCSHRCEKLGERNPARRDLKGRGKIAKDTADKWFSLIVRNVAHCERCGESNPRRLQCAHIFSRIYHGTRWDEDNAMCLCQGCHVYFTHRPIEWEDYVLARIGETEYRALRMRAQAITHTDYATLLDRLLARIDELGIEVGSRKAAS